MARPILHCRDRRVAAESPTRFPESPKTGETKSFHRTDWSHQEELATEPVSPGYRRGQQVLPRSSFPAHGPVPGPKHPPSLQDVPCGMCPSKGGLKRRFRLTFPSFFTRFSMLVTLCVSPVPTLEGGPGSGSLGRHLRLPNSSRWDFPTPRKDTSQKSHKHLVLIPKYLRNLPWGATQRHGTEECHQFGHGRDHPRHGRCLPDILHPPRCLWKHQENPPQVRQCKGWTGTRQNVSFVWREDFCNPK